MTGAVASSEAVAQSPTASRLPVEFQALPVAFQSGACLARLGDVEPDVAEPPASSQKVERRASENGSLGQLFHRGSVGTQSHCCIKLSESILAGILAGRRMYGLRRSSPVPMLIITSPGSSPWANGAHPPTPAGSQGDLCPSGTHDCELCELACEGVR